MLKEEIKMLNKDETQTDISGSQQVKSSGNQDQATDQDDDIIGL
jgi:hypothetical protein